MRKHPTGMSRPSTQGHFTGMQYTFSQIPLLSMHDIVVKHDQNGNYCFISSDCPDFNFIGNIHREAQLTFETFGGFSVR